MQYHCSTVRDGMLGDKIYEYYNRNKNDLSDNIVCSPRETSYDMWFLLWRRMPEAVPLVIPWRDQAIEIFRFRIRTP